MEGWSAGAETGRFGIAVVLQFEGLAVASPSLFPARLFSANRVDQVLEILPHHFFPNSHAILLSHAPRGHVFWPNQRNEPLGVKLGESEIAADSGCLRRQTLSP